MCRGEIRSELAGSSRRHLAAAYATTTFAGLGDEHDPTDRSIDALLEVLDQPVSPERTDAVADLVTGLTPDQRRLLIDTEPFLVGNTDGFPLSDRFEANQILIGREAVEERDEQRRDVLKFLTRRNVLLFDPQGLGRVAIVEGDLDRATHLAVWVPGMGSRLGNFDRAIFNKSDQVHRTMLEAADPGEEPATITWLGYDAPQWPLPRRFQKNLAIMSPRRAILGGQRLHSLLHWVDRHHPRDLTVTTIGFSYGSTTVSAGLKQGMPVDQALLLGSPGMVVDHVDKYPNQPPVYSVTSESDFVGWLAWFGADPSESSSGAIRLRHGPDAWGHTNYHEDVGSLNAMALTALGRGDRVPRYRPPEGGVPWRYRVAKRAVRTLAWILRPLAHR